MRRSLLRCAVIFSAASCFAQTSTPAQPPTPALAKAKDLGFTFTGVPDEGTFAINYRDKKLPTQFLKMGGTIRGTEYTIVGYDAQVKPPTLIIEHQTTHARLLLE